MSRGCCASSLSIGEKSDTMRETEKSLFQIKEGQPYQEHLYTSAPHNPFPKGTDKCPGLSTPFLPVLLFSCSLVLLSCCPVVLLFLGSTRQARMRGCELYRPCLPWAFRQEFMYPALASSSSSIKRQPTGVF